MMTRIHPAAPRGLSRLLPPKPAALLAALAVLGASCAKDPANPQTDPALLARVAALEAAQAELVATQAALSAAQAALEAAQADRDAWAAGVDASVALFSSWAGHVHDERYLEQDQPVVLTYGATEYQRSQPGAPAVFNPTGHVLVVSADTSVLIMALTAPTAIGGTQYRLASVEWCLERDALRGGYVSAAAVFHDQPGAPGYPFASAASDPTDRSTAGCYTIDVPDLSPRAYSFALGLDGQTTELTSASLFLQGVKATWIPR